MELLGATVKMINDILVLIFAAFFLRKVYALYAITLNLSIGQFFFSFYNLYNIFLIF